MTVDQLEEGMMQLWRDTWNAEAFAARKRHYRELLRARLRHPNPPPPRGRAGRGADAEADMYFALPTAD